MIRHRKKIIIGSILVTIGIMLFGMVIGHKTKTEKTKHSNNTNKIGQVAHYTRENMQAIPSLLSNKKYLAPTVDHEKLQKDITDAKVYDSATGKMVRMDVWDSWPVTNPDGTTANYHGYRLVVGLTAKNGRYSGAPTKMGLFMQKNDAKAEDISTWKFVGYVFNSKGEGVAPENRDKYLTNTRGEWSGSTVMMKAKDNTLRFFYANAYALNGVSAQVLTTAQITVDPTDGKDWKSGLTIDHTKTTDHKTVFDGDGEIYQRAEQGEGKGKYFDDDLTLRDPHFVADGDKYYLAFEGNTGPKFHYQGKSNFLNKDYYGSGSFFNKETKRLNGIQDSKEYEKTYFANGAIGKLELNKDFTTKKVMEPMVTGNATNDELERINLFKHDGKWYVFTSTWGFHMASEDERITKNSYLLGFVSDEGINGTYKPLNGNGLVTVGDGAGKPTMTYSYLVVPNGNDKSNRFVITTFLDNRTFAPSYLVDIDGKKTSMVTNKVLGQGVLYDNKKYYSAHPQSLKS